MVLLYLYGMLTPSWNGKPFVDDEELCTNH